MAPRMVATSCSGSKIRVNFALRTVTSPVVVVLLCLLLVVSSLLPEASAFTTRTSSVSIPSASASASSHTVLQVGGGGEDGDSTNKKLFYASSSSELQTRKTPKSKEDRTLYDVLGAKSTDSDLALKQRYLSLVKQLHPDSRQRSTGTITEQELDDELRAVNAAWEILSQPVERKKYDRQVAATKFTEGFASFLGASLDMAIPLVQQTAKTTKQTLDLSSQAMTQGTAQAQKAMTEGTAQAQRALKVLQLQDQARQLQQQGRMEAKQAEQLKREAKTVVTTSNKKPALLFQSKVKPVTSKEAQRLWESYQTIGSSSAASNVRLGRSSSSSSTSGIQKELKGLIKAEDYAQEVSRQLQEAQTQVQTFQKQTKVTQKAYQVALRKFEDAQKVLEQATLAEQNSDDNLEFFQQEQALLQKQTKQVEKDMGQAQDMVTKRLSKQQQVYQQYQTNELMTTSQELEASAATLLAQAKELQAQAKRVERGEED
jgi:curved DNA-binding protein CbpA